MHLGVSGHLTVDVGTKCGPLGQSWQGSPRGQLLSWVVLATCELWVHYFGRFTESSLGICCREQPWHNVPNHDLSCPDGRPALPSPHVVSLTIVTTKPPDAQTCHWHLVCLTRYTWITNLKPKNHSLPSHYNSAPLIKVAIKQRQDVWTSHSDLCLLSNCNNPKPPNSRSYFHPLYNALDLAPLEDMTHCCNRVLWY